MPLRPAVLALPALLLLPAAATAATKNGVTPIAPKAGASVPVGSTPTFRARARGGGTVWVHVCKSKRKDRFGVICHKADIGQMKRRGGEYRYTSKFFDFPEFWLNSPGTYYWQAHRIKCSTGSTDCRKEGPIIRFRVT
jgi:hypothetical protein